MKEEFYLSCLMASKICHDLIGSSSSLSFSMDMVSEDEEEINKDALSLASKSAIVLVNRLKYFRAAFGISVPHGEGSPANKAKELILDLFKEKEIYIHWPEKYNETINYAVNNINFKLILNIFLLVFYAIPKSGHIDVVAIHINPEEIGIMLTVKGYKITFNQEIVDILNEEIDLSKVNPRNIEVYFTAFLKQEASARLEVSNTEEGLKLAFTLQKI